LALALLLAAQLCGGQGGGVSGDFACPAGARGCTLGTSYIQRRHVLQRARAQALEMEELDEEVAEEVGANRSGSECCVPFSQWPNVDNGVTCGGCKALVLTQPYSGSCGSYCASFGHVCVAAAEERAESCAEAYAGSCGTPISGTSDMLCTCRLPSAEPACAERPEPAPGPRPPAGAGRIEIRGRQILVGGQPLHLKGVCWNPVPKGGRRADFSRYVDRDAELMAAAGINAVRTYGAIMDTRVLDKLWAKGIWVINSVYNSGSRRTIHRKVAAVKDHPAILMWTVGNEWNYNGLYMKWSRSRSMARVGEVARIIKSIDAAHPVASIYGEAPPRDVVDGLPEIDVWGMNVYSGLSFRRTIDDFARRSGKPLFMGEYGADAFNARIGAEDQAAQARATKVLTEDIVRRSSVHGGEMLGGFLFEFSDEWWKDGHGSKSIHDVGGIAPGGGPYPDKTFNEEWWGIVDVDRKPREAYQAFKDVALPK